MVQKSHNLINGANRQGVRIDWTDMRAFTDFTMLQDWASNSYLKELKEFYSYSIPTHCPGSCYLFIFK